MSAFKGRWTLIGATDVVAFLNSIKCPQDYTDQLLAIADGLRSGNLVYQEEFVVDRVANVAQCKIYVNNEKVKDYGILHCGVETEHVGANGRVTQMKVEIVSNNKIVVFERFDDASMVSTLEVSGDTLTLTIEINGQKCVMTFKSSS